MIKKQLIFFFLLLNVLIFSQDYTEIDKHAMNVPADIANSLDSLVTYLTEPAKNDYEKARAIYCWISNNIKYNTVGFFSGNFGDNSVENVFKTKISVCDGYANLFQAMTEKAGLECEKIFGYSKGYGYFPGEKFHGNYDHAWNVVKIEGKWYLIDATWGAGHVDEQKKFVPMYSDFYFMTSPDVFIFSHFPADNKWQLLDKSLSLGEFERLALPTLEFFKNGLNFVSHKDAIINNIEKNLMININSPDDIMLLTVLSNQGKEIKNMTFLSKEETGYNINIIFPQIGKYILNIYAKNKSDSGLYFQALQYVINVTSVDKEAKGYPLVYEDFYKHNCYLYSPLDGKLKSKQLFKIKAPDAKEIAIVTNGRDWIFLTRKKGIFEGIILSVGKGKIQMLAKFPGNENYWTILEYQGY